MTLPTRIHSPLWREAPVRHYMHTLRKQMGMSQRDIAAESGYAVNVINAVERGYLAPDFIQLAEIATCLGMRVALVPMDGDWRKRRDAIVEQRVEAGET